MANFYIALLRADGTEPSPGSGYARILMGEVDVWDLAKAVTQSDHIFSDVLAPSWGEVTAYAVYDAPEGGNLMLMFGLPKPVNCHAGTVPVIHKGQLLLGVDVSAGIKLYATSASEVQRRICKWTS